MCGCWRRESTVNPQIWESLIPCAWDYEYEYTNRGGFGLGQWTNVGSSHGRLWNLHTYVTSLGYSDGDGYGQLEFVVAEDYWTPKSEAHLGYQNLADFLQSDSTSLDDLVWDFLACWEGVTGDHYTERLEWANKILGYINEHENDGIAYAWIGRNGYLSENEIYNNSMVVYQYICNHDAPVPPTPPTPTTTLLWLIIAMKKNNERRLKPYVRN